MTIKSTYNSSLEHQLGRIGLETTENSLIALTFDAPVYNENIKLPHVLIETKKQLSEYFYGKRVSFSIPMEPKGTVFQQKVWEQVCEIEFGKTATYIQVAKKLGSALKTRAVGLANAKNPIPILIPCHRVIGKNGNLTGYAGGLDRKKWLLQHEIKIYKNPESLF